VSSGIFHVGRSDSRSGSRIEKGLAERTGLWDRMLALPAVWALIAVAGCTALLVPRLGSVLPVWSEGDVATFDVMMPNDVSVRDWVATEEARERALQEAMPVYDFEARHRVEVVDGITALFAACRAFGDELTSGGLLGASPLALEAGMATAIVDSECAQGFETALLTVVVEVNERRMVEDRRAMERRGAAGLILRDLATGTERMVPVSAVAGYLDVRLDLEEELRSRLIEQDAVQRPWLRHAVQFLRANLVANVVFARDETERRMRAAVDAVGEISRVFRRGQVLIRRGDTVTYETEQVLHELNQRHRDVATAANVLGIIGIVLLIVVGWWRLTIRLTGSAQGPTGLSMVFILLVLFVGVERLALFLATAVARNSIGPLMSDLDVYLWGLPHAAGAVTLYMLVGMQPAILFSLCIALASSVMLGGDFSVFFYALASGLTGALASQHFKHRTAFTRAGATVGVVNVVVVLVLQLWQGWTAPIQTVVAACAAAFLGGPVAVGVASLLLPVLEGVFGITTDIRLLELSNQNLPLLKRLSLEAPGTYQHSLAVGNLAEAGADAIGANALLLRVCAYYHDVGKLVKPGYFVENQRGTNPHDSLSPSMSALVIQSHVKEGLELACREKLPLPIRQGIATHHGTKLIRYFFSRAKEQNTDGRNTIRESDYRYAGPKPHTKELGVLLLADAVEAAARTLENPSPGRIQSMISKIFSDALEDGQLETCDLTFSELDRVATAFLWVLTNMYHHRIDYPGFDFNRRQGRRDSGALHLGPKAAAGGG
jgi:putative nucleotidyltransferase with HDIG domain